MMVHLMYKLAGQLDKAGELLDTDHPMEDIRHEDHAFLERKG